MEFESSLAGKLNFLTSTQSVENEINESGWIQFHEDRQWENLLYITFKIRLDRPIFSFIHSQHHERHETKVSSGSNIMSLDGAYDNHLGSMNLSGRDHITFVAKQYDSESAHIHNIGKILLQNQQNELQISGFFFTGFGIEVENKITNL